MLELKNLPCFDSHNMNTKMLTVSLDTIFKPLATLYKKWLHFLKISKNIPFYRKS